MKGYDGEPEATARAIDPEGWFHTGDLGVMRDDGYFKVTGLRQGHDHPGWRKRLSARGRRILVYPSEGRGSASCRRAG